MPTFPDEVQYTVTFKTAGRADLGVSGTPDNMTIAVAWNGQQVYGPTSTNQPGQSAIDVTYTAGEDNVLRVNLSDGAQQPYSQGGISGQPGDTASGGAPKAT